MIVVYRYSDGAQPGAAPKHKLSSATKDKCFLQFLQVFPPSEHTILVIADCVSDSSYAFLSRHIPVSNIFRSSYGSGAFSFLAGVQMIVRSTEIPDDALVYFVEDDYIHIVESPRLLKEGASISQYVTLYDHPDKYIGDTKSCEILVTRSSHWRTTPSTTMTFATTKKIMKEDWDIYMEHCKTGYPYDHEMFLSLGKKNRRLISCLPGRSTHAEIAWLSPFEDWSKVLENVY